MGKKDDPKPNSRIDFAASYREEFDPGANYPTLEQLIDHDPEVAEQYKDFVEMNAGPPRNPFEAAFYDVVILAKNVFKSEVSDRARLDEIELQFDRKWQKILERARTGDTYREQFDNLEPAGQDALFPKVKKKSGRKANLPTGHWVLTLYEQFLELIKTALGPGRNRDYVNAEKCLREVSDFGHLDMKNADSWVRLKPSQAAVEIVALHYDCSPGRVRQLLTEGRKERKAMGSSYRPSRIEITFLKGPTDE